LGKEHEGGAFAKAPPSRNPKNFVAQATKGLLVFGYNTIIKRKGKEDYFYEICIF
jgi:hypothetical protein